MSASVSRSVSVTMSAGVDLVAATSTPMPPARRAASANSAGLDGDVAREVEQGCGVDGCLVLGHPLTLRPALGTHRPTPANAA